MSTRTIQTLCGPASVAVIGASDRTGSIGAVVIRNLLEAGFAGPILPVNPKHNSVAGLHAYPTVSHLPTIPDIAIICTPTATILGLIAELGHIGVKIAIVVSSGTELEITADGRSVRASLQEVARKHGVRVLGPNCLGVIVPRHRLNASFSHRFAEPGKIAFVSQSGALCTAVLDWARPRGIGFSHFISLGDAVDLDFGDFLDYLASDAETRAILLYIEGIHHRRNFMSAARAAARNKPVVAIKSGRYREGARAAASHTGAVAGSDAVYDAALARAGILRVHEIEELFAAVETLGRSAPPKGERLAILTNGGGIGVMAVDELAATGTLAELSPEIIAELDAFLPPAWSRGNPVDILGDADAERYSRAVQILLQSPSIDALLCMHAPTALSSPTEIARSIIATAAGRGHKALMTCWMGEETVEPAREMFAEASISTYETPTQAVRAFRHLVSYRQTQEMLIEVPPSAPVDFVPDRPAARRILDAQPTTRSLELNASDSNALLASYGIPVVRTEMARDPASAGRIAKELGGPVTLKLLSPDLTHRSDVGGVMLNLEGAFEVEKAAYAMIERLSHQAPDARIGGFIVQSMARRPGAIELLAGCVTDPVFGPVILFGQGGPAATVTDDMSVGLPPLNLALARHLIERTRVSRLLKSPGFQPHAGIERVSLVLTQISQLVTDFPEIAEIEVNPLFVDPAGIVAVDSRVGIDRTALARGSERLAIRPYPRELEETFRMSDGRSVLLRPIRPEDEPAHHAFVARLSPEDIRLRFFAVIREISHRDMARLTQIDYDREMAFIAVESEGQGDTVGVVRTITDPDNEMAEYAIVVRSDTKGQGLGRKLMEKMIAYCRARGTRRITGQVLAENRKMLNLVATLGFVRTGRAEDDVVEVALDL